MGQDTRDTDGNGVKVYLQMNLTGQEANSLITEKISNDTFLDSETPGYICEGYELWMDATFDSALLTFELPENIMSHVKDSAIFYWNEETQLLEEVPPQHTEGNKVVAELTHFSKYICLDRDKYKRAAFRYKIEAPTEEDFVKKSFDLAFVLDDSGSVSYTDFNRMK